MQLSEKQQEAAGLIKDWYNSSKQTFYLAGYAGTGKTTIVEEVINGLGNVNPVYCAFTGKAASVLASKGNEPAATVHSLIYTVEEVQERQSDGSYKLVKRFVKRDPDGEYNEKTGEHEKKGSLIYTVNLIVLDECSMISEELYEDLLSFGIKVLVLGDPGQLPPVTGKSPFGKSDFQLTEIHRQAADSNILTLATKARKQEQIGFCEYDDAVCMKNTDEDFVKVFTNCEKTPQVICGTNKTRFKINQSIRSIAGYASHFPVQGEEIMCLRNDRERGLFNGQFVTCITHELIDKEDANDISVDELKKIKMTVEDDRGRFIDLEADFRWFKASSTSDQGILKKLQYEQSKMMSITKGFDFAHCITCHKSQGSQWDNVIVIDESKSFRADKNKWLYTALTRAAKKVWLLK